MGYLCVQNFKTDFRVLLFILRRADDLLGSIVLITSKTSSSVNSVRDQGGSLQDCAWQVLLRELQLPNFCLSFFFLFFVFGFRLAVLFAVVKFPTLIKYSFM